MVASKFTEQRLEGILAALRQGHYRKTAAELNGITGVTLSEWLAREEAEYQDFKLKVLEAEAEAEHVQLAKVTESAEPADAKWYLARKFPDRWAETRRVDVSGRLDMGIKLNADALADPSARAHIAGLTSWLFADGDSEPYSPGAGGDE